MAKKGPKRIAGMKVPKKMRKRIGKTGNVLQHPLVADLIAAGLVAAAAALRDNKSVRSAARRAKGKAGNAAQGIGAGMASLGTVIAAKAKEGADYISSAYEGVGANGSGASAGDGGGSRGSKRAKPKGAAKKKKK